MSIRLGSLFSGIAGFELGICAALHEKGEDHSISWQVEPNEFCLDVLGKHYPSAYRGITDVKKANQGKPRVVFVPGHGSVEVFRGSLSLLTQVDWIIGGFPCQDLSLAGKCAGLEGHRSGLFWEYLRIVRDLHPRLVIMENVPGLLTRGLGAVLGALAEIGYHAQWRVLSASDVGAPHRRERVFLVAYRDSDRRESLGIVNVHDGERETFGDNIDRCGGTWIVGDPDKPGWHRGGWFGGVDTGEREPADDDQGDRNDDRMADPDGSKVRVESERRSGGRPRRLQGKKKAKSEYDRSGERSREPFGFLGRGPHGVSARMDEHRLPERWPAGPGRPQEDWEPPRTTRHEANRAEALKAYGNAVCPKVAKEIGKWALEIDLRFARK